MPAPDIKTPVGFIVWTIGVLSLSLVARIGWECGGKLWSLF